MTEPTEVSKALDAVRRTLEEALVTARSSADVLAVAEAAVAIGEPEGLQRALAVLVARAEMFGHDVDIAAEDASNFAKAYRLLRDAIKP
ncbi:MAG TPA: hypothetical protein VNY84_01020 [Acidimicrobiales bacterium]|jgi:hypothetical protein|nr:hypothetical protein [Acidimicrobiales bacterium]